MKQDWKTIKALSCESSALPTHQRFHHLAAYQIPTRIGLKKKKKNTAIKCHARADWYEAS